MILSSLCRDGRAPPELATLEGILIISSESRAILLELGMGGRRARIYEAYE
jgi:hypothetical protein